ncbi:uncharacterized protein LOC108631098 [Ceratina calcarata]|uniref:ascorbate ferrireductase (transmembrane) n=1 Tax=Ceratina calcarata TaxID=156304 RepID=A0AAJ7NED4_9HYME|nr:uncharacterized protein LOC108631098 [Ceratina calcarata]
MSSFAMSNITMETIGSSNSCANLETRDTKGTSSALSRTLSCCVTIGDFANHILIGGLTGFTLFHSLSFLHSKDINTRAVMSYLHIVFCTVGYVLLMSEAIVIFTGLAQPVPHRIKKNFHLVVQILGVMCTVVGIVLMFLLKSVHFKSIHAILGLTSLVLMVPPFLSAFRYRQQWVRPIIIKFFHNFFGLSCFVIGMAAQCYGYRMFGAIKLLSDDVDVRSICIGITIVITILSVRRALPNIFKQFVSIFT